MREIKFRAWDSTTKKIISDYAYIGAYGMLCVCTFHDSAYGPTGSPDLTIEQFTGLRDKNGKEIYEGDILKNTETSERFYIKYDANYFSYMSLKANETQSSYWNTNEVEVIGNIHQNPELLEANK